MRKADWLFISKTDFIIFCVIAYKQFRGVLWPIWQLFTIQVNIYKISYDLQQYPTFYSGKKRHKGRMLSNSNETTSGQIYINKAINIKQI